MFYEEIRTKRDLSYIPFCLLRILYNSKFIMVTYLGTNTVIVTRVHCISRIQSFVVIIKGNGCIVKGNNFSQEISVSRGKSEDPDHCIDILYLL